MPQRQVNIRVDEADFAVLETAAYLKSESLPEMVRTAVEALASDLARESRVQALLRIRAEEAASAEGKLTAIDSKRKGRA